MTVITEDISTEEIERLNCNFIRIQNLPWTACRSDIREFFRGLSIKRGGILVRNFEAFVAFESPNDILLSMYRRNILLHGCKVELSIINQDELNEILNNIVRRKLDFENIKKREIKKFNFQAPSRKKIRPTRVFKGDKRASVSSSTFIPEESEFIPHGRAVDHKILLVKHRYGKRSICGTRKLHPTSLSDIMEDGKLAIFNPEEFYETKKIKLDVS